MGESDGADRVVRWLRPETYRSWYGIAQAAAELDGNPLANRPDLIRRAADAVAELVDDPAADDVLLFAAGLAAAA